MKIRELIDQEIDVDVYDDYDERCGWAVCGPVKLTEIGKRHYSKVLGMDVRLIEGSLGGVSYTNAIVHTETAKEAEALKDFVLSAAGYCSDSEYQAWFEEGER